jgi:putative Holliday junction resolvase
MSRILAIDYGTKRVGLAVTDPLQIIANTLATVETKLVLAYLKTYIAREEVSCIVVGKPLRLNGSDSESAVHVEKFVSLLANTFPSIPIARIDERYTSKIAKESMLEMGLKKKDRQQKGNIDQISAVLILQSYMESKGQV